MAKQFGGKFSPNAQAGGVQPQNGQVARAPAGLRSALLFVMPAPFLLTAFAQSPAGLALDLAAFGTMVLAAWLTREGIFAQHAYEARRSARRPAIPRKIFGSVMIGLGLFLGSLAPDVGLFSPVLLGLLGAGLHFAAFGPDPLADKGMEDVDTFQQDRVARVVDEAEKHLATMRQAIERSADRALLGRVDAFQAKARQMIRTVEEDPRDLTAARKYLGVYLMGARDASIKFADLWTARKDPAARTDYEALLTDLEANFTARTEALLSDNRSDLDVEIEVLRDRLNRDGLTTIQNGDAT